MLDNISSLIRELFSLEELRITKGRVLPDGERRVIPLKNGYFLVVKGKNLTYKQLSLMAQYFNRIIEIVSDLKEKEKRLQLIERELELIIKSNEIFFSGRGNLEDFFQFLEGRKFALFEGEKEKINRGIDQHTIRTTFLKLKKQKELELPYGDDFIYALEEGVYRIIVIGKLDELIKKVLKTRLMWLNKLYMEKENFSIDEISGAYTYKRCLYDAPNYSSALLINIKRFRFINELYGSEFGDSLLREVVKRIKRATKRNVYRIRGEKFLIFLKKRENPRKTFEKLKEALKDMALFHPESGTLVKISVEINAIYLNRVSKEVIENAILAFKEFGVEGDCWEYERDVYPLLKREEEAINLVRRAIAEKKVVPYFQPVLKIDEEQVVFYEALMRIELDGKVYTPGAFLPEAKKTGLYGYMSSMVLSRAFEVAARSGITVSVNLDVLDMTQKDFFCRFLSLLRDYSLSPERVIVEITEENYVREFPEEVLKGIEKLRRKGIRLALDDFGKGYSNFTCFAKLPPDIVKVDGSLIEETIVSDNSKIIVETLIELCQKLKIETVAEFVSSAKIFKMVKELGFTYAQGFYLGAPSPM